MPPVSWQFDFLFDTVLDFLEQIVDAQVFDGVPELKAEQLLVDRTVLPNKH